MIEMMVAFKDGPLLPKRMARIQVTNPEPGKTLLIAGHVYRFMDTGALQAMMAAGPCEHLACGVEYVEETESEDT